MIHLDQELAKGCPLPLDRRHSQRFLDREGGTRGPIQIGFLFQEPPIHLEPLPILMRSQTFEEHLAEFRHVLNQLSVAGAKFALSMVQWCRTKVEYVGLTVGANGIKPQARRLRDIQDIKAPTGVSLLRSFLGVCNYSQQFIEDYAEIARPLTELLRKVKPFEWGEPQEQVSLPSA